MPRILRLGVGIQRRDLAAPYSALEFAVARDAPPDTSLSAFDQSVHHEVVAQIREKRRKEQQKIQARVDNEATLKSALFSAIYGVKSGKCVENGLATDVGSNAEELDNVACCVPPDSRESSDDENDFSKKASLKRPVGSALSRGQRKRKAKADTLQRKRALEAAITSCKKKGIGKAKPTAAKSSTVTKPSRAISTVRSQDKASKALEDRCSQQKHRLPKRQVSRHKIAAEEAKAFAALLQSPTSATDPWAVVDASLLKS